MPSLAKAGILSAENPISQRGGLSGDLGCDLGCDFTCDFTCDLRGDCSLRFFDHFRDVTKMVSISNGSAYTSISYTPSHVIKAMGYGEDEANEAIRLSWCHLTPEVDWDAVAVRIVGLR